MGFSSGVASQCGFITETAWSTQGTVDHFLDITDASMALDQQWAEGEGTYAGGQYRRLSRTVQTTRKATGSVGFDVTARKLGPIFRQMLGSSTSTATLVAGSAYRQVHQNGSQDGLSMTWQFGVPQVSDGTVKPFTYVGTKVAGWELSCKEGELLACSLDLNAKDELTLATTPASNALAAAAYASPSEVFNFSQAVIKIGGTASTTSGVVSVAGGTTVASSVQGFSLKSTNDMNDGGFSTSNVMTREQKAKRSTTTLTLDVEFGTQAEFYDVWRAGTVVPVQITFTGSLIGGTDFNSIDLILSGTKIRKAPAKLNGDDLASVQVELEVGNDGVNKELQLIYKNTDTTL